MHQRIHQHFSSHNVSQRLAFSAFHIELIGQMQRCELKQLLKTFNKVCHHSQTVIIPIDVHLADKRIRLVSRADIANDFITTKKHHRGEIKSIFAGRMVLGVKARAFQQIHIRKFFPQVATAAIVLRQNPHHRQQVQAQVLQLHIRIHPAFRVDFLLANIHLRDFCRRTYLYVRLVHAVVNPFLERMYFTARRYVYMNQGFLAVLENFRFKVKRGAEQVWIANGANKILHHGWRGIFRNADNSPVVKYP